MNELQAMHIQSIAKHVDNHLDALKNLLEHLTVQNILPYPAKEVMLSFDGVKFRIAEIQMVLSDMIPQLPPDSDTPHIVESKAPQNNTLPDMPPNHQNW